MRTYYQQYRQHIFIWLPLIIAITAWSISLIIIPSFDLDEALYRQSALEMKRSGSFLWPTWEGVYYADKPPTFIWLIVLSSFLFDKGDEVSFFAARFPSFIAMLFILFLLQKTGKKMFSLLNKQNKEQGAILYLPGKLKESFFLPGILLMLAPLPFMGASAILIDPVLTFALTPLLCLLSIKYLAQKSPQEKIKLSPREQITIVLCLLFACMLKGPIGFIIPSLALFFHCIFTSFCSAKKIAEIPQLLFNNIVKTLQEFFLPFFFGLILATVFYGILFLIPGIQQVIYDFLIVQNFQRSVNSFEGHSGTPLYHFIVALLGGGFLVSLFFWCLIKLQKKKLVLFYHLYGFPFSWVASLLIFFSCMATKLPNYTWPIWPAFALLCALLFIFALQNNQNKPSKILKAVFYITVFLPALIGTLLILGGFLISFLPFLLEHTAIDARAKIVVQEIGGIPFYVQFGFILAGILFLLQTLFFFNAFGTQPVKKEKLFPTLFKVSLLNGLIMLSLLIFVVPFFAKILWQPLQNLTQQAEKIAEQQGELRFATLALKSPTVSSSFHGPVTHYLKGSKEEAFASSDILLAPVWFSAACQAHGFQIIAKESYIILCKKEE